MQSLESKSSRQTPKSFETESRPETFDTETETPKNGSRDTSRNRDHVSRLHHWYRQKQYQNLSIFVTTWMQRYGISQKHEPMSFWNLATLKYRKSFEISLQQNIC